MMDSVFQSTTFQSKELGRGSFGIVYGPFSKTTISRLFPGPFPNGPFIIKVIRSTDCNHEASRDEVVSDIMSDMPASTRNLFITPLAVVCTPREKIEIQKYGGQELFNVFRDGVRWACAPRPERVLMHCLTSLFRLMKACLNFIDKKRIFISDIKPENMVINKKGIVSMIDFDLVRIDQMPTNFVRSAYKDLCPVQMYWMISQEGGSQRFYQKYRSDLATENQKREAQAFLRKAKNVPPVVIAQFSIIWVFTHIFRDIFLYKCTDADELSHELETTVILPMYTRRYELPAKEYTRRIRAVLSRLEK